MSESPDKPRARQAKGKRKAIADSFFFKGRRKNKNSKVFRSMNTPRAAKLMATFHGTECVRGMVCVGEKGGAEVCQRG